MTYLIIQSLVELPFDINGYLYLYEREQEAYLLAEKFNKTICSNPHPRTVLAVNKFSHMYKDMIMKAHTVGTCALCFSRGYMCAGIATVTVYLITLEPYR